MSKELYITWQDIHFDSIVLARLARERGWLENCKGLIAVTRGGMIPTGVFSNATGIKNIETFCLASYSDKTMNDMVVLKQPELDNDGEGWLIIDDLVDSGKSLAFAHTQFPKARRLCLYAKPEGQKDADIYVRHIDQDTWIYFPWEVDSEGKPFER